jgi:DNA-directed RNA polymerase subunit RPC12/RpoP
LRAITLRDILMYIDGIRCPSCRGNWIIRVRRGRLLKWLRPSKKKYLCESCGKVFFAAVPVPAKVEAKKTA